MYSYSYPTSITCTIPPPLTIHHLQLTCPHTCLLACSLAYTHIHISSMLSTQRLRTSLLLFATVTLGIGVLVASTIIHTRIHSSSSSLPKYPPSLPPVITAATADEKGSMTSPFAIFQQERINGINTQADKYAADCMHIQELKQKISDTLAAFARNGATTVDSISTKTEKQRRSVNFNLQQSAAFRPSPKVAGKDRVAGSDGTTSGSTRPTQNAADPARSGPAASGSASRSGGAASAVAGSTAGKGRK